MWLLSIIIMLYIILCVIKIGIKSKMTVNEKKLELIKEFGLFCDSHKINAILSFKKHYKISKKNDTYIIDLKESELDYHDIESLKWSMYSTLFLVRNGRFPNGKSKFLFILFPFIIFMLSQFIIEKSNYIVSDNISVAAVLITIVIVNLSLAFWSRKKIKESDLMASNYFSVQNGASYLLKEMDKSKEMNLLIADSGMFFLVFFFSNYPSFIDRMNNLSTIND